MTGRGAQFFRSKMTVDKISRQLKQKGDLVSTVQSLQDNLRAKNKELDKLKRYCLVRWIKCILKCQKLVNFLSPGKFEGLDSKIRRFRSGNSKNRFRCIEVFNDAGQKVI